MPDTDDQTGRKRARVGERGYQWGPWQLAEVHTGGKHVGWGATCGMHSNVGLTVECKKSIRMGPGLDSAECELRMKMWLLQGLFIDMESPTGQTDHDRGVNARTMPLHTSEWCEAQLHTFFPP